MTIGVPPPGPPWWVLEGLCQLDDPSDGVCSTTDRPYLRRRHRRAPPWRRYFSICTALCTRLVAVAGEGIVGPPIRSWPPPLAPPSTPPARRRGGGASPPLPPTVGRSACFESVARAAGAVPPHPHRPDRRSAWPTTLAPWLSSSHSPLPLASRVRSYRAAQRTAGWPPGGLPQPRPPRHSRPPRLRPRRRPRGGGPWRRPPRPAGDRGPWRRCPSARLAAQADTAPLRPPSWADHRHGGRRGPPAPRPPPGDPPPLPAGTPRRPPSP